jgi:hypothetical protein
MGVWKMDVATVYPLGAEISLAYRKLRDLYTIPAKLFLQLRRPRTGHSVVSSRLPDFEEHDGPALTERWGRLNGKTLKGMTTSQA